MSRKYLLMVIPANKRDAANADVLSLDPDAGETFRIGLNSSGNPFWSPSHYWTGFNVDEELYQEIADLMDEKYPQAHLEAWDIDEYPWATRPDELLDELGLKRIQVGPF